jgi:hypothetical protein
MIYKYSTQRRSTDVENKKKVKIERPALGGKINKESPSVSRDQSMIMDEHEQLSFGKDIKQLLPLHKAEDLLA